MSAKRNLETISTSSSNSVAPSAAAREPRATQTRPTLVAGATEDIKPVSHLERNPGVPLDLDAVRSIQDRKSTRLNSSHPSISYAVFCLKKKKTKTTK